LNATGNDWISLHTADASDSSYLTWKSIGGSSGSTTFSAPSTSGGYEFRLFRNGQKVAMSNAFEVTAIATSTPYDTSLAAPSNLSAVPGTNPDNLVISWSDNSNNEDGFKVLIATVDGTFSVGGNTNGPNITSWSYYVGCGQTWNIQVIAWTYSGMESQKVKLNGYYHQCPATQINPSQTATNPLAISPTSTTSPSTATPVSTTTLPLSKPGLVSPANGSLLSPGTDVTLQWNAVSGATQYLVEIWGGQYGGSHATPCGWQSGSTSCHIGTMSPGNVLWRVKARDASNSESPWSDEWNFTPQ